MTNRKLWIAICLVVGVAAFFVFRSSQKDSDKGVSGPRQGKEAANRRIPKRVAGARVEQATADERRRRHAEGQEAGSDSDNDSVVEYVRNDGSEVRDHRKNPALPRLDPSEPAPQNGVAPVAPKVLMKLRKAFRPTVGECAKQHVGEASGAQAQIVVTASIAEEQMNIDKLAITTEGLKEDETKAFVACVEQQVGDREFVMEDAEDVSAHTMTFPFDL